MNDSTEVKAAETGSPAAQTKGVILSGLAQMHPGTLLDETALAQALEVSKRTLRRMVGRCELPPGIPFAGRRRWIAGKVVAHIEQAVDDASREMKRRVK